MFGFTPKETAILKALNTPAKIQDFLNKLPTNFEQKGLTVYSPRKVLQKKTAHCLEGALLAAVALRFQRHPPLVVDLTATDDDEDHVITVFKMNGHWGAISKSNHATLRYREPVYKTIRELVMSYFHEYYISKTGKKTLRSYSQPVNLRRFDKRGWMIAEEDVWYIPEYLVEVPHKPVLNRSQIARLRRADAVELRAGKVMEWGKRNPSNFRFPLKP